MIYHYFCTLPGIFGVGRPDERFIATLSKAWRSRVSSVAVSVVWLLSFTHPRVCRLVLELFDMYLGLKDPRHSAQPQTAKKKTSTRSRRKASEGDHFTLGSAFASELFTVAMYSLAAVRPATILHSLRYFLFLSTFLFVEKWFRRHDKHFDWCHSFSR